MNYRIIEASSDKIPFHGCYDVSDFNGYITTGEPEIGYKFYPHFHPFLAELIRRLIEKSVPGLQAIDTQYPPADGGMATLPDSTEVILFDKTHVTLPDKTKIKLNNTEVTLPGVILLDKSTLIGTTKITAKDEVTVSSGTKARLTDGTQIMILGNNVKADFIGGKPQPVLFKGIFSESLYNPSDLVQQPYPVKELDFTSSGAYSVYNWELFYHLPLTIAIHLSKNQSFEDAQRWFHYIFDPTDDSDGPVPERFWKVKPFQYTDVKLIEDILINLSSNADPKLRQETVACIGAWKDTPFRPHLIARYRQSAYMLKTVMAYLDNLVAWGDTLFRQDTGESINEATQIYVLAANILGPRPQKVPKKGSMKPLTYNEIRKDLDEFGNVFRLLESELPLDLTTQPSNAADIDRMVTINSTGKSLYFCVPRNDNILGYWDTVADRLFKIHNSLNIQGIFRQLPLFEPPIDPALLARAAAAGLDVGAIISGMNQPLPLVRFQFIVQKAAEICQEVKSLGGGLLSAIEKEDNEALSILRAKHERVILGMAETVKYQQLQEAIKSREGLEQSVLNVAQRYIYYERLLGKDESEIKIPEIDPLDRDNLAKMKFKADEPSVEPSKIEVDIAQDVEGKSGGKKISSYELSELKLMEKARAMQSDSAIIDLLASELSLIPQFEANMQPIGCGASIGFGGVQLSKMTSMIASALRITGDELTYQANKNAKIGSYSRREQEWAFQSNLAAGEITQIFKQIRAAQIREAIAEREWKNHQQQIRHAEEIERFLTEEKNGKRTNKDFYVWMKREAKGLYGQCFQFAFDIAKKAERALQHELGNTELVYLQFGYLAGKDGLLAGEKLFLDIKRMEMAYYELNQREYELTKHISLLQVDPLALLRLRDTGRCTVKLPEALFDMDGPGHYFRRIKTIALSIPCVTGPYASINCTLTLLKSSIRKTPLMDGDYARQDAEDSRFSDYFGRMQSIVTSSSQNDSGMFETNLHDERYLPFEGSGAVSDWQLELPANPSKGEPRHFDYDTISDVILHVRYTAREGGGLLRRGAMKNLQMLFGNAQASGSIRLFSVRHEFPTEWAKFQSQKPGESQGFELALNLRPEHYPFWAQESLKKSVERVDILVSSTKLNLGNLNIYDDSGTMDSLVSDPSYGNLLVGKFTNIASPVNPIGNGAIRIFFKERDIKDIWIAVTWSCK